MPNRFLFDMLGSPPASERENTTSTPTNIKSNVSSTQTRRTNTADDVTPHNTPMSSKTEPKECCTCCPLHKNHVKEILRNILWIKDVVSDFAVTQARGPVVEAKESFFANFQFPLKDYDDFKHFEECLTSTQPRELNDAAVEWSKYGGDNEYDFVKRVLHRTLSNQLANKFSWLGRKGKESFSITHTAKLLINSARIGGYENQKQVEKSVAGWLKRAAERIKKNTQANLIV